MKHREFLLLLFKFLAEFLFKGIYDHDYLVYTIRALTKYNDYDLKISMDPRQDTVRPSLPSAVGKR